MTSGPWKATAAKRRDERATKTPDQAVPHRSRKDTKRWCRGKVGVEHKPECRDYKDLKGQALRNVRSISDNWKVLICTACGKELALHYPMEWEKGNPPDWVK